MQNRLLTLFEKNCHILRRSLKQNLNDRYIACTCVVLICLMMSKFLVFHLEKYFKNVVTATPITYSVARILWYHGS
jgi:hypothetical protein